MVVFFMVKSVFNLLIYRLIYRLIRHLICRPIFHVIVWFAMAYCYDCAVGGAFSDIRVVFSIFYSVALLFEL